MPRVRLLMPLLPHISRRCPCRLRQDRIFAKKSAYGAAKTGSNDLQNLTDLRQSLKFFISLESPQEPELPAKVFYDDMYRSIIEGTGEPARRRINS